MKQCDYSKTVIAKRLEFIRQQCDEQGNLIIQNEDKSKQSLVKILRSLRSMSICQHDNRRHKAKFMCHFCYLNKGNQLKATGCKHTNRTHHSRGLCKSCYQLTYYKNVGQKAYHEQNLTKKN